jgi:hypothetical protein
MAPPGKSQPPRRDLRAEPRDEALDAAGAGPRAERAPDADDLAAMHVRVAEGERAREAAERRAKGLEAWTLDLEAKVAEARTRVDELDKSAAALRSELDAARARSSALEVELAAARREAEDALELERVKRGLEIDSLVEQHTAALAELRRKHASSETEAVRGAVVTALATLEELEHHERASTATRARLLERARRALTSGHVAVASPPAAERAPAGPTMPPAKPARKRARRQSTPPARPSLAPITKPSDQLETFEDLLDSSD